MQNLKFFIPICTFYIIFLIFPELSIPELTLTRPQPQLAGQSQKLRLLWDKFCSGCELWTELGIDSDSGKHDFRGKTEKKSIFGGIIKVVWIIICRLQMQIAIQFTRTPFSYKLLLIANCKGRYLAVAQIFILLFTREHEFFI